MFVCILVFESCDKNALLLLVLSSRSVEIKKLYTFSVSIFANRFQLLKGDILLGSQAARPCTASILNFFLLFLHRLLRRRCAALDEEQAKHHSPKMKNISVNDLTRNFFRDAPPAYKCAIEAALIDELDDSTLVDGNCGVVAADRDLL